MKILKDILYKVRLQQVVGSTNIAIDKLAIDSRKVEAFTLFIAIKGSDTDGHLYIDNAIEKGAIAIICESLPEKRNEQVTYILTENTKDACGLIACNFYDNPSQSLKLVGITGTNGKTTVATQLHKLFISMGHRAGLISTIVNKIQKEEIKATHTTPDAIQLNALLKKMVDEKIVYCFMEVSSHALDQGRVSGIWFTGAVFTNISHDHLDYHGSFNNYLKAKKRLFDILPENSFAILNKDDYHYESMIQDCKSRVFTFGLKSIADFKAKIIENQFTGLHLQIGQNELHTRLVGSFNAYNLLAIYGVACCLEQTPLYVLTDLSNLKAVEGRFEYIKSTEGTVGIVDYAHTPDALENVLKTIRDIRTGNESLICVIGCGGNRDKAKRPLMAEIAAKFANKVILTSDNPRNEDPMSIIREMEKGIPGEHYKKVMCIEDRRMAIKTACNLAQSKDIILVAGKGHEKYQEINGVKHPFDDLEELKQLLNPKN